MIKLAVRFCVIVFVSISFVPAIGQTFSGGNWNTASNWSPATVPNSATTNVTVSSSSTGTFSSSANNLHGTITMTSSSALTLNAGARLTVGSSAQFNATPQVKRNLTMTSSGRIDVLTNPAGTNDAVLEIWGDLIVTSSVDLNISGTLIVHGNFEMTSSGSVTVTNGGTMTVTGNFTGTSSANIDADGAGSRITVGGALSLTSSANIDTSGGGVISAASCSCTSSCGGSCANVSLPVVLTSFEANATGEKIALTWRTSSEINFHYFSVEKSVNGIDFTEIGTVEGHGTSREPHAYSFDDLNPIIGSSYYRLTTVDYDDYREQSKIIWIRYSSDKLFRVSPNPSDGRSFSVHLNFEPDAATTITVFNELGMSLGSYPLQATTTTIATTRKLNRGVYFVRLHSSQYTETARIIVTE